MATAASSHRPAIILDCDPGHDDALAIVIAAHTTELLGITTVGGNAALEMTTRNAGILRDLLGLDVEVHSGARRPLVARPADGATIHGASGLDGADLPDPIRGTDGTDAVGFLAATVRRRPGTWVVVTGPMTNLALALAAHDDLVDHLGGVSFMGGGTFGNRTPVAEYNVWADPDAAAMVIERCSAAGLPIVMAGLDVTHRFVATHERIARVGRIPGRLAAVLADLLGAYSAVYRRRYEGMDGAAVHDPLAVLALTHRHLFAVERRHLAVETTGTLTRGMTVIDRRAAVDRPEPNAEILVDVDADAAWAVLVDAVAAFSR